MLSRCRRFDAWSQQTLDTARKRFSLDERDAALCSRLCLTVLQNAALCDFYIESFLSDGLSKLEPQTRDILRLGVSQIVFMDRIPTSAAVSQSVELAKRYVRKASGLVNAVLRRISENRDSLPQIPDQGTARELGVRFSHRLWLCEKIVSVDGYDFARAYLAANNRPAGLTFSVNLCHTDAVSFAEKLRSAGMEASVSKISSVSVELPKGGAVAAIPGYNSGDFFVQDAAAAAAILSASPKQGMDVLDVCAAPGGKSLLCASVMQDRGRIVSCDIHEKKLARIAENAGRMRFRSICTQQMDGADPDPDLTGKFDLVICDVPCSGLGVIRKKPEIRYKSLADIGRLPEIQLRILRGGARCVKPGGTLLYSTCTVLKEENRDVIAAFLRENESFAVEEERTIWPQDHGTDGFYYCRMKRI